MPAFPTPCAHPGCHAASYMPYCEKHSKVRQRVSPSKRGYGRRHERWRRLVLQVDPVCHWPLPDGRRCLEPATIADHIKPRAEYPELAYDVGNGHGVCQRHHNTKTAEEKRGLYRSTR